MSSETSVSLYVTIPAFVVTALLAPNAQGDVHL